MVPKCTVFFLLIAAVQSATLQGRNIPVEVRYERLDHDINSNLAEKTQLSEDQTNENNLRFHQPIVEEEYQHNFIKNYDEKVQLSPEELLQSAKHIPIHQSIQDEDEIRDLEKLGELPTTSLPEKESDTPSKALIQQAQNIVENGLNHLKNNFQPKGNDISPSKELWEKLESDVKELFAEHKNKLGLRQAPGGSQQNIFQNFVSGFQQLTNNFVQQFQGQNTSTQNGTPGDEGQQGQQQGPIQGFIGYFTGGVQNIVSNIQNIGQSGQQNPGNTTVLGENGTGNQQSGGFFGSIVQNVQQLFQPNQGSSQATTGNTSQGDTAGNTGGTQPGFFAGAISQINQVVGNFIPTTSQAPPAAQGDEGINPPAANQPSGPIQQVVQSFSNIGTAFNQFIQGGQPQNKPAGSEEENTTNKPTNPNFIQSIGQNIGNAFQNIQNQFRPPASNAAVTPQKPVEVASNPDNSNPIVEQVSSIGNQLQQIAGQQPGSNPIQNLIPGSSTTNTKESIETEPKSDPCPAPIVEKMMESETTITAIE